MMTRSPEIFGNELMLIGWHIRLARTIRRIKQKDLAKRVHTAPSYLSAVEQGKRQPSLDLLSRIAYELEYDLPQLIAGDYLLHAQVKELKTEG